MKKIIIIIFLIFCLMMIFLEMPKYSDEFNLFFMTVIILTIMLLVGYIAEQILN